MNREEQEKIISMYEKAEPYISEDDKKLIRKYNLDSFSPTTHGGRGETKGGEYEK